MNLFGAPLTSTLPPADDRLYGPDAFGTGWLVLAVGLLLLASGGFAWAMWPSRRAKIAPEPIGLLGLRERYLRQLDVLQRQVADSELTPRALHHELSRTLRRFVVDLGTEGAASMSARALQEAGHPDVATAVRRFEHPQFEPMPESDPFAALGTAREIVTGAGPRRPARREGSS